MPAAKLRPFSARLATRPGGRDVRLSARIDGTGCHIEVDGVERSLEAQAVDGPDGCVARLRPQRLELQGGLSLSVQVMEGQPPRLRLELSARSAAMERARPLFGKLGGNADLARMIAPPRWALTLCFDAQGRYVSPPEGSHSIH